MLEVAFRWLDALRLRFERRYNRAPLRPTSTASKLTVKGNAIWAQDDVGRAEAITVDPALIPYFEAIASLTNEGANLNNIHLDCGVSVPKKGIVNVRDYLLNELNQEGL